VTSGWQKGLLFTGENLGTAMAKLPTSVKSYADRIRTHWHRAAASIMEVARLCADANNRLSAPNKKELVKVLPFSSPTFSKLAQIGDDPRLQTQRVQKLLPPSYSIIYSVGQLDDNELEAAIKEGIVTPTLKRSDLDEWMVKKKYREKPIKPPKLNLPDVFYAAIRLTDEPSLERIERLNEMLDQIRIEFNAEIIRPRDRYAEAMGRWHQRVQQHLRKLARRIVLDSKKKALARKSHRKMTKQDRSKASGFTWDETFIYPDDNEDRIQFVLDTIGRGDEFDKLRDQAYSEIAQPEPPASSESSEERQRDLDEVSTYFRKRRGRKKPNLAKFMDFK
jgi:hypothetical protein